MKFHCEKGKWLIENTSLVYRAQEFSFDVEPAINIGFSSITVNDVQIEIDENGYLLYVFGYCPYHTWKITSKMPPSFIVQCNLRVSADKELIPGVSIRINEPGGWPVFVNVSSGWILIEKPSSIITSVVEFAPDSIAVLNNDQLVAIWLHPRALPPGHQGAW